MPRFHIVQLICRTVPRGTTFPERPQLLPETSCKKKSSCQNPRSNCETVFASWQWRDVTQYHYPYLFSDPNIYTSRVFFFKLNMKLVHWKTSEIEMSAVSVEHGVWSQPRMVPQPHLHHCSLGLVSTRDVCKASFFFIICMFSNKFSLFDFSNL